MLRFDHDRFLPAMDTPGPPVQESPGLQDPIFGGAVDRRPPWPRGGHASASGGAPAESGRIRSVPLPVFFGGCGRPARPASPGLPIRLRPGFGRTGHRVRRIRPVLADPRGGPARRVLERPARAAASGPRAPPLEFRGPGRALSGAPLPGGDRRPLDSCPPRRRSASLRRRPFLSGLFFPPRPSRRGSARPLPSAHGRRKRPGYAGRAAERRQRFPGIKKARPAGRAEIRALKRNIRSTPFRRSPGRLCSCACRAS